MLERKLNTAWIWATDRGVNGLVIDTDTHMLHWYDEAGCSSGCSCGGTCADQTLEEYLAKGTPGGVSQPPADVEQELMQTVETML